MAAIRLIQWLTLIASGAILAAGQDNSDDDRQKNVVVAPEPTPSENYPHQVSLDEEGRYHLFWKFDDESITFEVHVKTHGWVGFGLSPSGGMKGSDIVVGWIGEDGEPHFKDRHATGNERPIMDEVQDYNLLTAMEMDKFTVFKFSRKLETCDSSDYHIQEDTVRVIFAWNDDKPTSEDEFVYHGATQRGTKSVVFLNNKRELEEPNADSGPLLTFNLTYNNVRVPSKKTYYHCRIMALPELSEKHHIVKVSPIIHPGNEGIVHHIIAYFCYGNFKEQVYGQECWSDNMPANISDCTTMAMGWAVGAGDYVLPKEAGLSIGGKDDPRFFYIETHYDNPEYLEDVVDSSGLSFHYTNQLRAHDVGMLILGHSIWWPPMMLPPGAEKYRVDTYCGMSCTNKMPADGIHVFMTNPHTHLTGSRVWTKHIRNGTELAELTRDNHYDFNYQAFRDKKEHVHVLPGDEFLTVCEYNTMGRDKPSYGGPATEDEMCLNFIGYYPKMDIQSCLSGAQGFYPVYRLLMTKAMKGGIYVDPAHGDDVEKMQDYLDEMEWTPEDIQYMQKQIDQTFGYTQYCVLEKSKDGLLGGGSSKYQKAIKIDKPYVKESKCEPEVTTANGARRIWTNHVTESITCFILLLLISLW